MSWHYLPELAAGCSVADCSAGHPSAPWKKSRTAERCCSDDNGTVCSTCSQSGTTSAPSPEDPGVERWISSRRVSPVNRGVPQENNLGNWMDATSGRKPFALLAKSNPNGAYWRTSQRCLALGISDEYSQTWPKSGLMLDGACYLLPELERLTFVKESGSWPTPTSRDHKDTAKNWEDLAKYKHKKRLACSVADRDQTPGQLNPPWVEWLMGFPIEWTALKPLETDRFLWWLREHGKF